MIRAFVALIVVLITMSEACSPSRTNGTETLYRAMARSGKPKNRQKTECLSGEDGCSSERADRISFDHLVPPTRKTAENKELRKVNRDTAAYLHQLEGGNHHRGDRKRRPAPRRGNNEDIINTAYSTQSVVNISARIFGDRESGRKRGRSQVLKVTEKVESESSKNGSNLMWLNPGKTNSLLAPENGNETGNNENHHSPGSIDKSQHFPMLQKAIQEENCGISSNKTEVNQMKRLSDRNNTMSFASVKLRQNLTEEAGNRLDKIRHNSLPLNMESSMKNYSHKSQHLYAILPNVHSNDVGFLSKSQGTSDGQQRNGTDFTPSNILRSMQNMPSNLNLRGPLSYSVPSDTTEFSASPSSSSRMKGTTSIETAMNERKTLGTTTDMMRSFPKISSNGPPQIRDKSTKTTRTTATFKANKSINLVKTNDNKHEKTMAKKFVQLTPYDLKYTTQPMGTTIKNMSTKTTEELQGVDAIKGQNNYSNVPRRCISESRRVNRRAGIFVVMNTRFTGTSYDKRMGEWLCDQFSGQLNEATLSRMGSVLMTAGMMVDRRLAVRCSYANGMSGCSSFTAAAFNLKSTSLGNAIRKAKVECPSFSSTKYMAHSDC